MQHMQHHATAAGTSSRARALFSRAITAVGAALTVTGAALGGIPTTHPSTRHTTGAHPVSDLLAFNIDSQVS